VNDQDDAQPLTAATLDDLARLAGLPPLDDALVARIAEGAARAAAAVRASATGSLFDVEPAAFLAELERLAEPPR